MVLLGIAGIMATQGRRRGRIDVARSRATWDRIPGIPPHVCQAEGRHRVADRDRLGTRDQIATRARGERDSVLAQLKLESSGRQGDPRDPAQGLALDHHRGRGRIQLHRAKRFLGVKTQLHLRFTGGNEITDDRWR